jgi:hypothetical protein
MNNGGVVMVKLRVQGLPEEVEEYIERVLKPQSRVLYVSDPYKNRNSEYVRVYVEARMEGEK